MMKYSFSFLRSIKTCKKKWARTRAHKPVSGWACSLKFKLQLFEPSLLETEQCDRLHHQLEVAARLERPKKLQRLLGVHTCEYSAIIKNFVNASISPMRSSLKTTLQLTYPSFNSIALFGHQRIGDSQDLPALDLIWYAPKLPTTICLRGRPST